MWILFYDAKLIFYFSTVFFLCRKYPNPIAAVIATGTNPSIGAAGATSTVSSSSNSSWAYPDVPINRLIAE
ncbi:hypothetical protein [Flavobacterium sp.]